MDCSVGAIVCSLPVVEMPVMHTDSFVEDCSTLVAVAAVVDEVEENYNMDYCCCCYCGERRIVVVDTVDIVLAGLMVVVADARSLAVSWHQLKSHQS